MKPEEFSNQNEEEIFEDPPEKDEFLDEAFQKSGALNPDEDDNEEALEFYVTADDGTIQSGSSMWYRVLSTIIRRQAKISEKVSDTEEALGYKRIVNKNGVCNTSKENISGRNSRFIADFFTTLVDLSWRWNLLVFGGSYLISWVLFGVGWYMICYSRGEFEHLHDPTFKRCVQNIMSFSGALLFSIESQHTIGYGFMHVTTECPEAIVTVCFQSLVGVMLEALLVGVIFAKVSTPKNRRQTLLFSRRAVVCFRDGKLCLMFRIGDVRKSHIINGNVRAILITNRETEEGEIMAFHQEDIEVQTDTGDSLLMLWPLIITHVIDSASPFYFLSENEFYDQKFELVVILNGCIESTGSKTEARSSYLPGEILWGHRFENLMSRDYYNGYSYLDYSKFHTTYPIVSTPRCSAHELESQK